MTEIRVPTLGESVTEATIGRWFKKAGDAVAVDEPLVELETDKVTIEVPAPSAGVVPGSSDDVDAVPARSRRWIQAATISGIRPNVHSRTLPVVSYVTNQ